MIVLLKYEIALSSCTKLPNSNLLNMQVFDQTFLPLNAKFSQTRSHYVIVIVYRVSFREFVKGGGGGDET